MSTRFVFIVNYLSKFQDNWLKMPVFNDLLAKHESPYKAYCKLCVKTIELSNMAKRALTSHADSFLEEAEEKENLLALSKARALRAKAKSVKSIEIFQLLTSHLWI